MPQNDRFSILPPALQFMYTSIQGKNQYLFSNKRDKFQIFTGQILGL